MAISDLPTLRLALADWLVGQAVSSQIDTFIDLAEAEFNRKLRVAAMLTRAVATIVTDYVALPADWLEAKNITVGATTKRAYSLHAISMDVADQHHNDCGQPKFFAVSGQQLNLIPAPTGSVTVELVYYARIPSLEDWRSSNWLIGTAPDLYLNCALAHAQPYLANPGAAQFHRAEADRILEEMRFADTNAAYGAAPLITRTRRYF